MDRQAAQAELLIGAELAADDSGLLVYAASQLYFLGAFGPSRDVLALACDLDITERWISDEIVHLRGRLAFQDGQLEEAERLLWEAVNVDPSDAIFLDGLLTLLIDQGRTGEAQRIVRARRPMLRRPELLSARTKRLDA